MDSLPLSQFLECSRHSVEINPRVILFGYRRRLSSEPALVQIAIAALAVGVGATVVGVTVVVAAAAVSGVEDFGVAVAVVAAAVVTAGFGPIDPEVRLNTKCQT